MPQEDELPGYDPATNRFTAPSYLGPESTALLNRINDRIGNAEALSKAIAFGTALNLATGGSGNLTSSAQAMAAVPEILRDRIRTEIGLALAGPEFGRMSQQERNFWEALRKNIGNPSAARGSHIFDGTRCWCGKEGPRGESDTEHAPHDMSGPLCWCGRKGIHGGRPR